MKLIIIILITFSVLFAQSETFPAWGTAPVISDFITTPSDTFYCATDGDNATGDGSVGNPWYDLRGANGSTGAGDLVYFRAGLYNTAPNDWSDGSENQLTDNGTEADHIVITNYPSEVVYFFSDSVVFTFGGDYQVFLGTMVGDSMGIQIDGCASADNGADHCQMSGVYIKHGGEYGSNPALFTYPHNTYTLDSLTISYCQFDSSRHNNAGGQGDRMVAIRLFTTSNFICEYNLFTNCSDLYQGGGVYFKDATTDAVVRNNKFINSAGGVSYCVQGDNFNGLDVYNNLSKDCTYFIYFISDLAASDEINIYNNVVLDLTTSFFYYLNADNQDWTEHGDVYNNVIDGTAFTPGWANGNDTKNIPDLFDYNLWYSASDTTSPAAWTYRSGYNDNAVISNNAVTYSSADTTCTVEDDYAGIGAGRYGDIIGGFVFTGDDNIAPTGIINITKADDDSVKYAISSISADLDSAIISFAGTPFDTLLTADDFDTTLFTTTTGYKTFTTYMVDDSSNAATYYDSLLFELTVEAPVIDTVYSVK
jgi:hypothetical protein